MVEESLLGRGIRLLLSNQQLAKRTPKSTLKQALSLSRDTYSAGILQLTRSLEHFALELIFYPDSDTFFLRTNTESSKRVCNKKLIDIITILSILFLESGSLEIDKFNELVRRVYEKGEMEEIVGEMKRMKYLVGESVDGEVVMKFGWRFYVDFPDFDPCRLVNWGEWAVDLWI